MSKKNKTVLLGISFIVLATLVFFFFSRIRSFQAAKGRILTAEMVEHAQKKWSEVGLYEQELFSFIDKLKEEEPIKGKISLIAMRTATHSYEAALEEALKLEEEFQGESVNGALTHSAAMLRVYNLLCIAELQHCLKHSFEEIRSWEYIEKLAEWNVDEESFSMHGTEETLDCTVSLDNRLNKEAFATLERALIHEGVDLRAYIEYRKQAALGFSFEAS